MIFNRFNDKLNDGKRFRGPSLVHAIRCGPIVIITSDMDPIKSFNWMFVLEDNSRYMFQSRCAYTYTEAVEAVTHHGKRPVNGMPLVDFCDASDSDASDPDYSEECEMGESMHGYISDGGFVVAAD